MKILIVGDQHFKLDLPYSSYFEDKRRKEWDDVKNKIHEVAEGCDVVALMGDNLNSRHNNSAVIDEFVSFLKGFGDKQLHILSGNHERFGQRTAIDFLDRMRIPTWEIYTEPTIAPLIAGGNLRGMFVPYLTPSIVNARDKEDGVIKALEVLQPADIAFFHQGITGASVHGQMVDLFNEIVLPIEDLEIKYPRIFSGHVHEPQELSDKTIMTGSIFTAEVGEEKKYIFVYDTETKLTERIELPVRGIYKVEFTNNDAGWFDMGNIPSESIVKATVTNKNVVVDEVREALKRFDAHVLIEKYPSEREKLHFENGALDLSLDNILKVYAEAKGIDYSSLQHGLELLK